VTMRVECNFEEEELQGDYKTILGVVATCSRCGYTTESFGTGEGSKKRCLVLMREECPEGEHNFYVDPDDDWSEHWNKR